MGKPAFDPSQDFEQVKPEFDPSQNFDKLDPQTTSSGQAGLEHFANAAALGYLPQIQALASQASERLFDPNADVDAKLKAQGFNVQNKRSTYLQDRDASIKRLAAEASEHPYASAAGTVAGSIAGGAAMSGIAPMEAAGAIGRIGQAAKGGAILGALSNPGDEEGKVADGLQLKDRLVNSAVGGGIGAAGQGLVEGVSAGAKALINLPASMQQKAQERAFKSAGAMLRDYRKAAGQGRINELGQFMLDNGLVKPGMDIDDIAHAAENLKGSTGNALNQAIEDLGTHEAENGGAQVLRSDLANDVRGKLIQDASLPSVAKSNSYFSDMADQLEKLGNDKMSIADLQKLKATAGKNINWDRLPNADIPVEEQFNRAVYSSAKDALERRAEQLAESAGRSDYVDLKKSYQNASDIDKIAKDQALRHNANRFFSAGDYAAGGVGAIGGMMEGGDTIEGKLKGAAVGFGLGLAHKAAREYGTPLVSQALSKGGQFLARTGLDQAGRIIAPALNAAERSPLALAAADTAVSQPGFGASAVRGVAGSSANGGNASDNDPGGYNKTAALGVRVLGIQDQDASAKLMNDPVARDLLVHAAYLPPNSSALKKIKAKLQKGYGVQ